MNGLQNLLVLKYNNYFNRKIKNYETKADYLLFGFEYKEPINFNSNDGVDAVQVLTLTKSQAKSDYIVILKEDSDQIESRWFIIETIRLNGNQYRLILRRDVISDYAKQFEHATSFIERGICSHDNPMIYNHEPMQFNKIKQNEILLKNKADCGWIVLYFARDNGEGKGQKYGGVVQCNGIYYSQEHPNIGSCLYEINYQVGVDGPPAHRTTDSEFEVFAIPYTDKEVTFTDTTGDVEKLKTIKQNKEIVERWVSAITAKYSQAGLYDAQLVPYVSIDNETLTFDIDTAKSYILNADDIGAVAVGFCLKKSKFTLPITAAGIPFREDVKESNELDLYRVTSPNGVGSYEYSPAKNGFVNINEFEADVTLKPINPYIKVNPKFNPGMLYGGDFNDYRGLICNGNFSLTILNNQWLTYELNSKNYKTMFDREIETVDKANDYNFIRDIAGTVGGAIGGVTSGAVAGTLAGGPVGGLIGGAFGGAASAAGGSVDVLMNEKEREMNKQLRIDLFNMSHDNVKARATSLTRSTIFNVNNKIFPYVEYFTCTPEEVEYFRKYVNLRGYTIGTIDNNFSYVGYDKFIQGSIIDIGIQEDYHLVEAINKYFEIGFRYVQN